MYSNLYNKLKSEYLDLKSKNKLRGGFVYIPPKIGIEIINYFDIKYVLDILSNGPIDQQINKYNEKFRNIIFNFIEIKDKNMSPENFVTYMKMNSKPIKKTLEKLYQENKKLFDEIADKDYIYDKNIMWQNKNLTEKDKKILNLMEKEIDSLEYEDKKRLYFFEKKKGELTQYILVNINNVFETKLWQIIEKKNVEDNKITSKITNKSFFNYYNDVEFDQNGDVVVANIFNIPIFTNGSIENASYYQFGNTFGKYDKNKHANNITKIKQNLLDIKPNFKIIEGYNPINFIQNINNIQNFLNTLYNFILVPDDNTKRYFEISDGDKILNKKVYGYISTFFNIKTGLFTKLNPLIFACITAEEIDLLYNKPTSKSSPVNNVPIDYLYKSDEVKIDRVAVNNLKLLKAYNYFKRLNLVEQPNITNVKMSPKKLESEFLNDLNNYHDNRIEFNRVITNILHSDNSLKKIGWDRIILNAYMLHIIINTNIIPLNKIYAFNLICLQFPEKNNDDNNDIENLEKILLNKSISKINIKKSKFILHKYAMVDLSDKKKEIYSFNTCGETTIMNLINYVLIHENGNFVVPNNASEKLKEFYRSFPSINSIENNYKEALYLWSIMVANIKDIEYAKEGNELSCELRSLPKNMATLLDTLIPNSLDQADIEIIKGNNDPFDIIYYNIIGKFITKNDSTIKINNGKYKSSDALIIDDTLVLNFSGRHSLLNYIENVYNSYFDIIGDLANAINITNEYITQYMEIVYKSFICNNYEFIVKYKKIYDRYIKYIQNYNNKLYDINSVIMFIPSERSYFESFNYINKTFNQIYKILEIICFKQNINIKIKLSSAIEFYIEYNKKLKEMFENNKIGDEFVYILPNSKIFLVLINDLIKEYNDKEHYFLYQEFITNPEDFQAKISA
jgi:hypothetical protein